MVDEKGLEAVATALEPKCRSFTGGANQLAKAVARELAITALQALSPGSTGEAEGWVLVPKELTNAMLWANAGASDTHKPTWNRAMWAAFLAAAPPMTSPTTFFAESAGEIDHSPDTRNMVSAAVPSEEEIARVLATALRQEVIPDGSWRGMVESFRELEAKFPDYAEGYSTATDAFRQARAVLALFAPILAEKEREIERYEAMIKHEQDAAIHWCGEAAKFNDRALAAEAALAAERERCAKVAERVGNFGDYRREELTADFGQPRFDMMHAIIAAIRSQEQP